MTANPAVTPALTREPDSNAFWDNRSTAHLGPVDLASLEVDRRVERITISGNLPVGPDGFSQSHSRVSCSARDQMS